MRGSCELTASRGLKKLYLHDNPIGDEGGRALATSPFLNDIVDLTLDGARLSPNVVKR